MGWDGKGDRPGEGEVRSIHRMVDLNICEPFLSGEQLRCVRLRIGDEGHVPSELAPCEIDSHSAIFTPPLQSCWED